MRSVVLLLAVLAIGKFGYQEYMYRITSSDLIVKAYGEQAMLACQVDALSRNLSESYVTWSRPAWIGMEIGRRDLDVAFWDVSHADWQARYGSPTLLIVARREPFVIQCAYDINERIAHVWRDE